MPLKLRKTEVWLVNERLFGFAVKVLDHLGDVIDMVRENKLLRDLLTPGQAFTATVAKQVETSFVSQLTLAVEGHIVDALAVARLIFEYRYQMAFFMTDPSRLGEQWKDYEVVQKINRLIQLARSRATLNEEEREQYIRLRRENKLRKLNDSELELLTQLNVKKDQLQITADEKKRLNELGAEYSKEIDEFTCGKEKDLELIRRKYFDNWTKLKIAEVADKAGLEEDYRTAYKFACAYAHPSHEALEKYLRFDEEGNLVGIGLQPEQAAEDAPDTIIGAAHAVLHIVELTCDFFKIDYPDNHGGLCEELGGLLTANTKH